LIEAIAAPTMEGPLKLVREINHRVINEFTEAIASLSVAATRSKDRETRDELATAADRLRGYAEAHRALAPPTTGEETNLADHLARICETFARATLAEWGVLLLLDAADVLLAADECWRIGLIVAELIRNAARHGLQAGAGGISVRMLEGSGEIVCVVRDTGRKRGDGRPGQGQRVIRSLVADFGGTVEWSFTTNGCSAIVRLPGSIAIAKTQHV